MLKISFAIYYIICYNEFMANIKQKRGHLKPCSNASCPMRSSSSFICMWGGWNAGLGCYVSFRSRQDVHQRKAALERSKRTPAVLNIGFLKTSYRDKDVERRPLIDVYKYSSEFGRAAVHYLCPFCFYPTVAYIWSFAASGKRCSHCGAIANGSLQWESRRKRPFVDNFDIPKKDLLNLNKGIAGLAKSILQYKKEGKMP